ncbi:hypothetical protein LTS15_005798 [Exophiala xenobiotica]|nr:hypothetical protein LTS15_005798 [Exophiala xenobiotica]
MALSWTVFCAFLLLSSSHAEDNNNHTQGFVSWQESPNERGTMDIVWSCLFTVFICVWTAVHLNVPAPPETDSTIDLWLRRIKWVWHCCLAPEIVMLLAAGQWSFARVCWRETREILAQQDEQLRMETGDIHLAKSCTAPAVSVSGDATPSAGNEAEEIQMTEMSRPRRQRFETFEQRQQRTDDERWTLRHAFFANMGGFRLKEQGNPKPYIVNAKHINYLVLKGYIDLPTITTLEINDRSKSDSLAKFLAVVQCGWLAVQVVARPIQKLETTSLEITTLSFVLCTMGSFTAWYRKPYDVQTSTVLEMKNHLTVSDIDLTFLDKGQHRDLLKEYQATHPNAHVVDASGRLLPPYTKLDIIDDGEPTLNRNFNARHRHLWGGKPRDPNRIRNDRLPLLEVHITLMAGLVTFGYAGLHAAAWNIPLATHIEQLLWRISSIVMLGCCAAWFGMDHIQEYNMRRRERRQGVDDYDSLIPWWRPWASIAVAFAYSFCRIYILVESFLALRWMPISSYQQVDWGKWVPHV